MVVIKQNEQKQLEEGLGTSGEELLAVTGAKTMEGHNLLLAFPYPGQNSKAKQLVINGGAIV